MEAKNRRARYLTSISPYISSPAALELPPLKSLAVRDEHLGRPRPQLELVERAEVRALDALVDAPDAGVEEDHRRRHLVRHYVLELTVQVLALVLVEGAQRLVQDLVHLVVLEVGAVEAARG